MLARAARRVARFLPVLVLPAAAWFWVSDGDTFALAAVETAGTPRISPDWIEHALEPELGAEPARAAARPRARAGSRRTPGSAASKRARSYPMCCG